MSSVAVWGGFDDLRSADILFLQEASGLGRLTVFVWSDDQLEGQTGRAPKFPLAEREYFLRSLRYVNQVVPVEGNVPADELPNLEGARPDVWVDRETPNAARRENWARAHGMSYKPLRIPEPITFPELEPIRSSGSGRPRVVVTGCYDWLHSGHVRFFEEVSAYGDLYVVVGHDANIRLLKGAGHPLIREQERRYMVGSIRFVTLALISTGQGWLDADPEIDRIRPQIYAVNEDGDKGGKREYCAKKGLEYLVLKRTPAAGLPTRSSTNLRGF